MNLKSCGHLIFIASPFHAWMAKEYLYANDVTDYQIILWLHDQHTHYAKTQLNNTIDYLNLRNIIIFEFPSSPLKRVIFERQFLQTLKQKKIPSVPYYSVPLHLQQVFKNLEYKSGDFPVAEQVSNECLSLPMSPYLKSEDQNLVIEMILSAQY